MRETPTSDGAADYFIAPVDGATLSGPVTVRFGLPGMGVTRAGTEADNTGHHHLPIARAPVGVGEMGADELAGPVPSEANRQHVGGGQTEVMIDIAPGSHTLQLVPGDWTLVPHDLPVMS